MDIMQMMKLGALVLAGYGRKWTKRHEAAGFTEAEWNLLVQDEMWTGAERRRVRSVLAEAVNVSLTLAQLPSEPLPGQYVAAVIALLVSPANRLVAAHNAPETYDGVSASGLVGPTEVVEMSTPQMVSLVMAYSSSHIEDLPMGGWTPELRSEIVRQAESA